MLLEDAIGDPFHDLALEEEGDDKDGDGGENGDGGHVAPIRIKLGGTANQLRLGERHRDDLGGWPARKDQGNKKFIPTGDKIDQKHSGETRADHRQNDMPEHREEASPIHLGCVFDFNRYLAQKRNEHPDRHR